MQLRRALQKTNSDAIDYIEDEEEEEEILEKYPICKTCGKGIIDEVDLGIKILLKCNLCQARRVIDKNK